MTNVDFTLTEGTFYVRAPDSYPGIPSSGTYRPFTYTTVQAYSALPTTFSAPVSVNNGDQIAFYLAIQGLETGTTTYSFDLALAPSTVPEPSAMLLLSTGLGLVGTMKRKWRR